MKKKTIVISALIVLVLLALLCIIYFLGSGYIKRADVALLDYSVSEDGTEITLKTTILSSMGYTRGFKDNGGGVKPHYLTFYSTFGGLNSSFGAKDEHILAIDAGDSEIYFSIPDDGYQLVLKKDEETGEWVRP